MLDSNFCDGSCSYHGVFCYVIGFQRGKYANWQLVRNDGTAAQILSEMKPKFGIATGGILTLFIAAPPDGSSV